MNAAKQLVQRLSNGFDAFLPAEKRDAVRNLLQDFAYVYPKLAAFLILNVIITGIPLLCFAGFALTILLSSFTAALFGAIVVTFLTTTFAIFAASFLLLPTIFLTTLASSSLFFWGLAVHYIFVYLRSAGDDVNPQDNAIPSAEHNQSPSAVHSDDAMNDKVHDWSWGSVSWIPGTNVKSIDRPKVEAKDSAVGLDGHEEKPLHNFDAMASQAYNENDDMSSVAESIRSELALPAALSLASSKLITSKNRKSFSISLASTLPASTAPGQPFQYAKLRKEHPDGLRQDSKGLFKVDEIASDSSLEEPDKEQRPDANQPLRKRSASSFVSMSQDSITAMQPLKRGQTAIHLPTNVEPRKLNSPSIISQTKTLSMHELPRSLDYTDVKQATLKEGINPATGIVIPTPLDPLAANADIEDNCESEPESRKSSAEMERLVDDTTSADEMDFAKMPPTPEDERDTIIKSSISPYTGEIVESYFGDQGARARN